MPPALRGPHFGVCRALSLFMAGLADTIQTLQFSPSGHVIRYPDNDDYDPHEHRKIEKPTTYVETMSHMLKGSVGAGILAMPDAVGRLGIVYGIIGVTLIGAFATFCIHLLIDAQYMLCKRLHRGYLSYPKSMRIGLEEGPPCLRCFSACSSPFVEIVLVVWQLGLCTCYSVFISENTKQTCDYYGVVYPLRVHMCFALVLLVVVNMVKDLKLLTPMSTVSNVLTLLGLIIVFFYLIEDDVNMDDSKLEVKRLQDIPIFIGTTLFALEAVGVILALEYNMEHPKRFLGWFGLFNIGMLIILVLYMMVGVFGYLKYGSLTEASITLNLPKDQKKAQAAKIIYAIAILLTFPLQNYVPYIILWRKWKKRLGPGKHYMKDYILRLVLIILPWGLGVAVPTLGPFISLFGAVCLSLLAIVFPAVLDVCVRYGATAQNGSVLGYSNYGVMRFRLVRDVIIVILGVVCLVSGSYSSTLEIIASFSKSDVSVSILLLVTGAHAAASLRGGSGGSGGGEPLSAWGRVHSLPPGALDADLDELLRPLLKGRARARQLVGGRDDEGDGPLAIILAPDLKSSKARSRLDLTHHADLQKLVSTPAPSTTERRDETEPTAATSEATPAPTSALPPATETSDDSEEQTGSPESSIDPSSAPELDLRPAATTAPELAQPKDSQEAEPPTVNSPAPADQLAHTAHAVYAESPTYLRKSYTLSFLFSK